ncbi:MAG: methionyl-tRNA formyltransferase [Geminicoccaceae bacterium]
MARATQWAPVPMSEIAGRPRLLFMGVNAIFSCRHLKAVAATAPVCCVVETVRPLGRLKRLERRLLPSRLARTARAVGAHYHEIPYRDPNALLAIMRDEAPDLVIVASLGRLLRQDEIAAPRLGILNVHPSLLPSYRGSSPSFWQLRDGVSESGVTVHLIDPGMDTGPILAQTRFALPFGATPEDLLALQLAHGPGVLVGAVRDMLAGTARLAPQPETSPTRPARGLIPADAAGGVWLEADLDEAWRLLRAVGPILNWPPARRRDLGWLAFATERSAGVSPVPPGRIGRDERGSFLAHPQGRIHLRWRWLPRAWLLALRRKGSPGGGVIALETAAGLSGL